MYIQRLKAFGATQAAHFFELKKESFWEGLRDYEAMNDSTQCLRKLFPSEAELDQADVCQLLEEVAQADFIRDSIDKYSFAKVGRFLKEIKNPVFIHEAVKNTASLKMPWGRAFSTVLFCFVALRLLKPEIVVETGCATGWTSTLILYALHLNQKGCLYSIDIPAKMGQFSMDWEIPEGLSPGYVIPEVLRDRWTLILGNALDHLMPLLQQCGEIDCFLHDSDHTYGHMIWEYTSVWPHLKTGGLLISDDIGSNSAAWDFSVAVGTRVVIHRSNTNLGALSKLVPLASGHHDPKR